MTPASYQDGRKKLLVCLDRLQAIRDELQAKDPILVNGLPNEVRQKMFLLDRESTRLRNPDLTIAFVGGFSAGKSSLVNAFLGRYLLPEATKVTTAVPTYVRSTNEEESAELHYLSQSEIETLSELYRKELAAIFQLPELAHVPFSTVLELTRPLATEGRGRSLLDQFKAFEDLRNQRQIDARGKVVKVSIKEAQEKIKDEREAMFMDRVVLRVKNTLIPEDVVLVDLPGISVPNPRHRDITLRFVREDANAIVFVLRANALFSKDECEIVELIRMGESQVAAKTFWVLNRWDSLTTMEQQRQTIADFDEKMREFAIPSGYVSFRTNALHGLLAQLGMRNETSNDLAHFSDYKNNDLPSRYGGSHETAFRESQIPQLQESVLGFLNGRLRHTTIQSAIENARSNFCDPVPHHLRRAKDAEDTSITGGLKQAEAEEAQLKTNEVFSQRKSILEKHIQSLIDGVAVRKVGDLTEKTEDLVSALRTQVATGPETDAYEIYKEIIAGRELRKYPYFFEIEMRIVDNLNTMFKKEFRRIVRGQLGEVFEELVAGVQDALETARKDVAYNAEITARFDEVVREESKTFVARVDGVVMSKAAELDLLLVEKQKHFFGLLGGNELLKGLSAAAKMGLEKLTHPGQAIEESDFTLKTQQIRHTLADHYIKKVTEYRDAIAREVYPIVINNMQQIKLRIIDVLQTKYRPALEIIMSQATEGEFAKKRQNAEERSRWLREMVEQIERVSGQMGSIAIAPA